MKYIEREVENAGSCGDLTNMTHRYTYFYYYDKAVNYGGYTLLGWFTAFPFVVVTATAALLVVLITDFMFCAAKSK